MIGTEVSKDYVKETVLRYRESVARLIKTAVLEATPLVSEKPKITTGKVQSAQAKAIQDFIYKDRPFEESSEDIAKLASILLDEEVNCDPVALSGRLPHFGPDVVFGKFVAVVPLAKVDSHTYPLGQVAIIYRDRSDIGVTARGMTGNHLPSQTIGSHSKTLRYATRKEINEFFDEISVNGSIKNIVEYLAPELHDI